MPDRQVQFGDEDRTADPARQATGPAVRRRRRHRACNVLLAAAAVTVAPAATPAARPAPTTAPATAPAADPARAELLEREKQFALLKKTLGEAQEMLTFAEKDLKTVLANGDPKPSVEDWARVEPTMETLVGLRNELATRTDALRIRLGENHTDVVHSRQELEALIKAMNAYANGLHGRFVIRWSPDGIGGKLVPRDLTGLRTSVQRLKDNCDAEEKNVEAMRRQGGN